MSLELIGTLTAIVLAAGVIFGGLWTLLAHYQRRLDDRFSELKGEITAVRADITALSGELTGVKIAVARLEGPAPRLLRAP